MSLIYRVMYTIGFTQLDTDLVPAELSAPVEGGPVPAAWHAAHRSGRLIRR